MKKKEKTIEKQGDKLHQTKILSTPKKPTMRQTVKDQKDIIIRLVAKMKGQQKFLQDKQKFTCEVDCPECKGKGQITKSEGLKIDFVDCPACQKEGRLYFQGIGDFFIKSLFEKKQAEDLAKVKEAEAKAELEKGGKDEPK